MLQRLSDLDKLDEKNKSQILSVLDGFLQSVKIKNIAAPLDWKKNSSADLSRYRIYPPKKRKQYFLYWTLTLLRPKFKHSLTRSHKKNRSNERLLLYDNSFLNSNGPKFPLLKNLVSSSEAGSKPQ